MVTSSPPSATPTSVTVSTLIQVMSYSNGSGTTCLSIPNNSQPRWNVTRLEGFYWSVISLTLQVVWKLSNITGDIIEETESLTDVSCGEEKEERTGCKIEQYNSCPKYLIPGNTCCPNLIFEGHKRLLLPSVILWTWYLIAFVLSRSENSYWYIHHNSHKHIDTSITIHLSESGAFIKPNLLPGQVQRRSEL